MLFTCGFHVVFPYGSTLKSPHMYELTFKFAMQLKSAENSLFNISNSCMRSPGGLYMLQIMCHLKMVYNVIFQYISIQNHMLLGRYKYWNNYTLRELI